MGINRRPRRCSMEGCCTTPSSEILDGGGVAARREGDIPAETQASTAEAEVLQREHGRGQGVWWEANATHPWRSTDALPHHCRKSLMEEWLHAGRVMFQRKSWQVQQQPKPYDGRMVVGKSLVDGERNLPLAQQRCCATIVRTL